MVEEKSAEEKRLNWRLPLCVVVGACIVLLSLMVYSPDGDLLYILVIAPLVCLMCLVLLLAGVIRKRPRQCLSTLLTLIAFLAASGVLLKSESGRRTSGTLGEGGTRSVGKRLCALRSSGIVTAPYETAKHALNALCISTAISRLTVEAE